MHYTVYVITLRSDAGASALEEWVKARGFAHERDGLRLEIAMRGTQGDFGHGNIAQGVVDFGLSGDLGTHGTELELVDEVVAVRRDTTSGRFDQIVEQLPGTQRLKQYSRR